RLFPPKLNPITLSKAHNFRPLPSPPSNTKRQTTISADQHNDDHYHLHRPTQRVNDDKPPSPPTSHHLCRTAQGFIVSNPTTVNLEEKKKMKADGIYYENKDDRLVRVFAPEHGGRSRTSHTKYEMLISVDDKLVKVANREAWPSTSMNIHCSPITEGCIKVTADDTHLLNQGTPRKSASALRVDSSRGSQSCKDDSPKIHNDDTMITSSYIPQLVDEENYQLPLQMEKQELFAGGSLLSVGQQQTATNAP
ncbi:hypothetical protein M8C21_019956, partial [Ambrosia artemisiifolia]